MEGSACFEPATDCDPGDLVAPILEYDHDVGCAVTGGYRYRGRRAPTLAGHYLFGDYCSGTVWGAEPNRDGVWVARVLARTDVRIVSFGEDERGELYIVEFGGDVHRLVSREIFASGFESGRFTGWKRKGAAEIVTPGLVGSGFALAVPASGGAGAYVRTRASRRLPELEIAFHLNTGELELVGGATDVLALADGRGVHLRVTLEQLSPKRGRATLWVADGQGVERRVGRVRLKAGATDELTVAWRSASHASAGDGFASLAKNGSVRASAADLATGARFANALELGLPSGAPAGSLGWLLIDRVSLRR